MLETNASNAENNAYDNGDWKNGNDRDTEIIGAGGYKGNRTTMLDEIEKSTDIVDDKKRQSSSQHANRASEVMNAMQENKKKELKLSKRPRKSRKQVNRQTEVKSYQKNISLPIMKKMNNQ